MKYQDFKRICDSEDIGNLLGIFYYPDNLPPDDPRMKTTSVFAMSSVMPSDKEKEEYIISPDFQENPEHPDNTWAWRTYFNEESHHSNIVLKFAIGQGTEEELRELIHIFKKGYKEIFIKDKIISIEKDFA